MKSKQLVTLILSPIFILFLGSCGNPLGSKSVSNPSTGDGNSGGGGTGGGGGGGGTASCDGVAFVSQTAADLSTATDSNIVTMANCSGSVSISVAGDGSPALYKNGSLVSGSDTITSGDTLKVRLTSSSTESTNHQATVTIGGNVSIFSVTTGDFTPAAFTFTPATGQALSALITSESTTISGFDGSLTASVTGAGSPVILVNGTSIGTSGSVQKGNGIAVKLTSSSSTNTTRQATVTIGGVSATFDVTTAGDATAPSITSVTAPASGSYNSGTTLDFTANFTENVTVTGTPRLVLNVGGSTKYANYLSGTGTAALIFRYTVTAGTDDSDGISVGYFQLNGGTINDSSSNAADLAFLPPSTGQVLVDTTTPSVQSATAPANGTYYIGQNLNFTLTFNEAVNVTGTPRLTLTVGSTTQYANYISGSGTTGLVFRYTVQTNDSDTDGIAVTSPIDLNGGTIADTATNSATLTYTAPSTSSVNITACPTNYIAVPALSPYTSSDFCVAKYEMKNVGSVATSQATGNSWNSITRASAITACANLGTGYSLISNAQWQTIARNIEGVAWNWSGGVVGSAGGISKGNVCNAAVAGHAAHGYALPASTDDNPCSGITLTAGGTIDSSACSLTTWNLERRVHQLSNGGYIWDLAGNTWEWIIDNSTISAGTTAFVQAVTASTHTTTLTIGGLTGTAKTLFGPAGDYTTLTSSPYGGLGQMSFANSTNGGLTRGGQDAGLDNPGIFAIGQNVAPTTAYIKGTFRCVYVPQ